MQKLNVAIIDNLNALHELKYEWCDLLASSSSNTCFLTFEWMKSWSECYINSNHHLFILCFYMHEKLVGLAPFYILKKKVLHLTIKEIRFLGTPQAGSDYLDVIIKEKCEKIVANTLYDILMHEVRHKWDVLSLQDILANSLFFLHFMRRVEKEGKYYRLSPSSYCPYIKLAENYDDYFAMLSKKRRKEIKHDLRILTNENNFKLEIICGEQVSSKLPEFFHLYKSKKGKDPGKLQDMLAMYVNNTRYDIPIQINMLIVDNTCIAALLHIKYEKTLHAYLMVIDKEYSPKISLGNLLVWMCIKKAIEDGYTKYDFLKGEEDYKFHWTNTGCRAISMKLWKDSPLSKCFAVTTALKDIGKIVVR